MQRACHSADWQTITIRCPHHDWQCLEDFEIDCVDLRPELLPISFGHALFKQHVEVLVGLEDRAVGGLRDLVIAGDEVHLSRELVLERREEIDKLMRLVAALRIAKFSVNELLKDEVARRVIGQIGAAKHDLEVRDVTVQVAGNENLGAFLEMDDVPATTGRGANQRQRLTKVGQHSFGSRHADPHPEFR